MTMSDRIAVINHGVLQQIAPPLTCYNEPANLFVAGFIGSPSMNFFEGRVDGDRVRFDAFDIDVSRVALPDGLTNVTMGIRHEDVYPAETARSLDDPTDPVGATVDVLEPVGEQIYAYLDTGTEMADVVVEEGTEDEMATASDSLLMGTDPDSDIAEGDDIDVVFDRSKIHLFEADSGDAIVHGTTAQHVVDGAQ
jgi:multiple sugar transport system ATP-binding protein